MRDGSASARSKVTPNFTALYLRVSTEEQRERQSIDTQREFGAKYTELEKLREKLDEGVTRELKRQLVEVLVDGISVETVGSGTAKQAIVNVRYRFVSSLNTCTDTGSCNKRNWSTKAECQRIASDLLLWNRGGRTGGDPE